MSHENKASDLLAQLASIDPKGLANDPNEKNRALALSKKLATTLESPMDRVADYIFQPFSTIALNMATGMKLFEHISAAIGVISSAELSKLSGADEMLITRILRVVASIDFVEQTGPYEWLANKTTQAMAIPPIAAGYRCEILTQSAMSGRKFLGDSKWQNPSEPRAGLIQYANGTKLHLFEFLASQPALFADFNMFMEAASGTQSCWLDWFDVQGRLLDGYDSTKNDTLLVDVGGGKGHDTQKFFEQYGARFPGSVVLQDQPGVIDGIKEGTLDGKIVKMGHDFFEPQPVKGAKVYFLQHILHDWSDKYCLMILKHIRDAMTPGYSKLIIHDIVLPAVGASENQARFDLVMMAINSGMERSAHDFTVLLETAGFKVTETWSWPDKNGIVEAEVAV